MYVCMYVVCMYVCEFFSLPRLKFTYDVCMYVCMYVCMNVCI